MSSGDDMTTSAFLEFRSATVGYSVPVVRDVGLEVRPGELLGLIGPNGSGKTTLVRAVTRAATLFTGEILVHGRGVGDYTRRELARTVGVLPQAMNADFSFSSRRFVEMGRHAHVSRFGDLGAHDVEAVERAMALTDTDRLAGEAVDTLSGGDLQRLTLAQALAQEPDILLLDEPTSHLDLDHRLQVLDVVRQVADEGKAVLVVFHDLDMAARYSDRLATVFDGGVGPSLPPRDVLTTSTVREVFGVRSVIGTDPVTGSVSVTPVLRDGAPRASREQRILVVCGSGTGAAVMRRLALAGFSLDAAALAVGDTDLDVARAVGAGVVELVPFGSMNAADEKAVAAMAAAADAVVVCETPIGSANIGNLRAALGSCARVVILGSDVASRDFSDGEATLMLNAAVAAGASTCDSVAGIEACVEEVLSR